MRSQCRSIGTCRPRLSPRSPSIRSVVVRLCARRSGRDRWAAGRPPVLLPASAWDGSPITTVPPMLSAASTAVLPGPENTGLPNEPIDVQLVCAAPRRFNMPRVLLELRPSPFSPNATQRWKRRSRSSPRYDPRELPGTSRLGSASPRHPAQQSWASCLMKRESAPGVQGTAFWGETASAAARLSHGTRDATLGAHIPAAGFFWAIRGYGRNRTPLLWSAAGHLWQRSCRFSRRPQPLPLWPSQSTFSRRPL